MDSLKRWHDTRLGLLVFLIAELGIFYGFACLSLSRGNLWWYLFALIALVGALKNFFKLIGSFFHGKQHKTN